MCHHKSHNYTEWSGNRRSAKPKTRFNPNVGKPEQGIGELPEIYGVPRLDTEKQNSNTENLPKTN